MRKHDGWWAVLTLRLVLTFLAVLLPAVSARADWLYSETEGGWKDTQTGLVWLDYTATYPPNAHTFGEAQTLASNLVHLGKDDWRVPTKAEMLTAFNHRIGYDTNFIEGTPKLLYAWNVTNPWAWSWYWWSCERKGNRGWAVGMWKGDTNLALQSSRLLVVVVRQGTVP